MTSASRSLKIAVADDESAVREYFAAVLERWGHSVVVVAADGNELVAGCRDQRPDLLITDIRMDGYSGIEAMRELAKDGPLPTILISAHYLEEELQSDLDANVMAFLAKPVKLDTLKQAVAEVAAKIT